MNRSYLYRGEYLHGAKGDVQIKMAACCFVRQENISTESLLDGINPKVEGQKYPETSLQLMQFEREIYMTDLGRVQREEKGKPFFSYLPVEFSVSNCKGIWMCTMSDRPCGLDVQDDRESVKDYKKLANRFYKPGEVKYVEDHGREGFFQIWNRREALGKYTGQGFFGNMPELVEDDSLVEKMEYAGKTVSFFELPLQVPYGRRLYCVLCIEDEEPGPVCSIEF